MLEAKREAYTLNLTTDIIDDKQLTLEEAFGIDTKEDLNPIIHDEPIDRPKGQLNILQWNAYHLTDPKIQILSEIAVDEKIDIICIQEMTSMKYPKPPKRLPRFNRPRYILPDGSKGLTIYIRQGLEFTTIKDTYTKKQPKILHQACRIRLTDTTNLRIDNIYIHPDTKNKDKKNFWNYLGSQTDDLQIILGDANEKASILGGGNKLLYSTFQQLIDLKGYTVLNTGEPTRIQKSGNSFKYSALDITLATKQASKMIKRWKTMDDSTSDHLPIITKLTTHVKRKQIRPQVYKIPYTELRTAFKRIYENTTGDPGTRLLETLESLKGHRTTYTPMHRVCKWWNPKLQHLKTAKNRARATKQVELYVTLRKEFRRAFRRARRKYRKHRMMKLANSKNPW